jgi:hypothetical protein
MDKLEDIQEGMTVEIPYLDLEGDGDGTDGEAICKVIKKESPYYTVEIIEGKYNKNLSGRVLVPKDSACCALEKGFSYV